MSNDTPIIDNDIVTWLRDFAAANESQYRLQHQVQRLKDAANEIETLRMKIDELKYERMRDEHSKWAIDMLANSLEQIAEIQVLTQERDEARRVAAIALAKIEYEMTDEQINKDALRVAKEFGWNCFKETE